MSKPPVFFPFCCSLFLAATLICFKCCYMKSFRNYFLYHTFLSVVDSYSSIELFLIYRLCTSAGNVQLDSGQWDSCKKLKSDCRDKMCSLPDDYKEIKPIINQVKKSKHIKYAVVTTCTCICHLYLKIVIPKSIETLIGIHV